MIFSRLLSLLFAVVSTPLFAGEIDFSSVPGVVVDHLPASENKYLGSPSIAKLADGTLVVSRDYFGRETSVNQSAIFHSTDKGKTWTRIAVLEDAFWSSLFVHKESLYLLGTTKEYGNIVLRRSNDSGKTWTTPTDENSGLLFKGRYHCAPTPVVVHNGRLWRAFEDCNRGGKWGEMFGATMLSVPIESDLLQAGNWTVTNVLARDTKWLNGAFFAWLEGNAVPAPDGSMVDILRVQYQPFDEKAAIVRISADGKIASFNAEKDFVEFPGGSKKFSIRYDEKSRRYWALSNAIPQKHRDNPNRASGSTRNTLALVSSDDLRTWTQNCIVLYHPDVEKHGYQYSDWIFDGNDILAVVRTAHDDGLGGAKNQHDSNFITFHRIANFRTLKRNDLVPNAPPE